MANDPVEIARELIRCQSVTPTEGGALAYLEKLLKGADFEVHRVKFSEPGTADVENLYARIGKTSPNFMFAGHTDVVPPGDEKSWKHPPFGGEVDGGMLYGRGAVDMKGAIACFAAAALDYVAKNKPKGSISFLITGDEEGPSINGTKKLLAWAAARGEKFDHCLVGEPTSSEAARRRDQDRPPRQPLGHAHRLRQAGPRRLPAARGQPDPPAPAHSGRAAR